MKVSDQIASLEMIGVDVWRHVYFPRFWAIVLTFPMLVVISFMGLMGAYWYSVYNLNLDGGYFWSVMNEHLFVSFDVFMLMIKGITFPFIIAVLTLYFGTHLKPTPAVLYWRPPKPLYYLQEYFGDGLYRCSNYYRALHEQ